VHAQKFFFFVYLKFKLQALSLNLHPNNERKERAAQHLLKAIVLMGGSNNHDVRMGKVKTWEVMLISKSGAVINEVSLVERPMLAPEKLI